MKRIEWITILASLLTVACAIQVRAELSFTRVTTGSFVNDGGISAGVAWGDYNNDGYVDLFVTNWSSQANCLYLNDGGAGFTKIESGIIVDDTHSYTPYSSGASWGDMDNDGFPDMFVANQQNRINFLYRNKRDGDFSKITSLLPATDGGASFSSCWGDFDLDGSLDLFVANDNQPNFLYRNLGGTAFERVQEGDIFNDVGNSFGAAWGDYDNDGDPDLFVANREYDDNCLYRNSGDGTFIKVVGDPVVSDAAYSHGGSWGDYDNDGFLDLFVANGPYSGSGSQNLLYHNNGDGSFAQVTSTPLDDIAERSGNGTWGDFDNDGDLDLYVTTYVGSCGLFENTGGGTFIRNTTSVLATTSGYSSGMAAADYDNDGDLDVFVANWENQNNCFYRNEVTGTSWVRIRCLGTASNSMAIGTRVRVAAMIGASPVSQIREIRTAYGHRSQSGIDAHFGLGDASIIDTIEIRWPAGAVDTVTDASPNQIYIVVEGMGVVCGGPDTDLDGIPDVAGLCPADNCVDNFNPDQTDSDGDGYGDACDDCAGDPDNDIDADGLCADIDNCPSVPNPDQADADSNGIGDACCCVMASGNVDCDSAATVDIGDLTRLIDFIFISYGPLCCPDAGNVDGSLDGVVDIGDLTALVEFLFISYAPPAECV